MVPAKEWPLAATHERQYHGVSVPGFLMLLICLGLLLMRGLVLIEPNEGQAVLLLGKYKGTNRKQGYHWINPLAVRPFVSLKARNFERTKLKVNDKRGNPVEIGAVVGWQVKVTAQALSDVEHSESDVAVQTESALRSTAAGHPYDAASEGEFSMRSGHAEVDAELMAQLIKRISHARIGILETQSSHLAHAPKIAGVMLRRQQAEAIIDGRQRIVGEAVGMFKAVLDPLDEQKVVAFDSAQQPGDVLRVGGATRRPSQTVYNQIFSVWTG